MLRDGSRGGAFPFNEVSQGARDSSLAANESPLSHSIIFCLHDCKSLIVLTNVETQVRSNMARIVDGNEDDDDDDDEGDNNDEEDDEDDDEEDEDDEDGAEFRETGEEYEDGEDGG